MKRIEIVEKDNIVIDRKITKAPEPEAIKQHVFEKREQVEPTEDISFAKKEILDIEKSKSTEKDISAFKKRQTEKTIERSDHSTAFPRPDWPSLSVKSEDFKIIEKVPPDLPSSTPSTLSKEVKNTSNISISNGNKKPDEGKTHTEFVRPKTSIQFNLTWKDLKSTELKYEFLKQIDPQDLPKIFFNSLESNVFSGILEVLVQHYIENRDPVFNILDCFTQVKRFGTFTMFMSASDKNSKFFNISSKSTYL